MIDQYRGLPRQVYILMTARLIIAMGTFVFPFLTMFLSSRMDMTDQEASRYLLLVALVQIPANLLGGKLADRFNRKRVYGTALLLSAGFFTCSGFFCDQAFVVYLILVGYFFSNIGQPILSAMMMDVTNEKNRQESFSLIYLGFNIGYAVGPLVAGLLFENHTPWIFWGQALLTATAVALIWTLSAKAQPKKDQLPTGASQSPAAKVSLWSLLRRDPVMLCFALFLTCYSLAYSQISYLMPLDLEQVQGISAAAKSVSLIWSFNGAVVFLGSPIVVLLTKKYPAVVNTAVGGVIYMLAFGSVAFTGGRMTLILPLVLVWTVAEILCNTNSGVFIANHAPATHRARYQSVYDLTHNLGKALGPLVMGFYLGIGHTYHQGWLFVAIICGLAAFGLALLQRRLVRQADTKAEKS